MSGYKVSAQDRDAIQELKETALKGEFDILLVFMFDRIGRIDDETPFVVEWFAKHGIEVLSTQEGQQRLYQPDYPEDIQLHGWCAGGRQAAGHI